MDQVADQLDALTDRMLDRAKAEETDALGLAMELGRHWQSTQGRLLLALGSAQQAGVPGGLDAWIARNLDVTPGSAIGMMRQAKTLGTIPELAKPLASGAVGPGTISALARTARAVRHEPEPERARALAETLQVAQTRGAEHAKRHVQVLEETVSPGKAGQHLAEARQRSFLRVDQTESGMCRIEGLLDPERGTVFRATLDQTVAAFLRARQYDNTELVPEDVRTTEQLQAEALTWMAKNFTADPARELAFSPATLYTAPLDPQKDAGLAETVYGIMVPRTILPPPGHASARLLHHTGGQPLLLDGRNVDPKNSSARLADPRQRLALAWRDRTCRYPGCTRPPTFSLHAHHRTPYSRSGPTTIANLELFCAAHHTLTHQSREHE